MMLLAVNADVLKRTPESLTGKQLTNMMNNEKMIRLLTDKKGFKLDKGRTRTMPPGGAEREVTKDRAVSFEVDANLNV